MKKTTRIISLLLAMLMILFIPMIGVSAEDNEKLNFLMLGDSIAWGAGVLNSSDACYAKIIADSNGYNYKTLASNGNDTGDLLNHFEKESDLEAIKQADIICMSVGGNNYLYVGIPKLLGDIIKNDYSRFDRIGEEFKVDFEKIILKIKEVNPDVTIIVQTLYNPMIEPLRKAYQNAVDRIDNGIKAVKQAHPESFEILDLEPVITPKYIALDTIHPTAKGNELIAKLYLEKLKELGLGENTTPVVVTKGIDQIPKNPKDLPYLFRYLYRAVKFYIGVLFK